eukprot:Platyproteum_vivax@DN14937_c0_g1_i1.p1
MVYNFEKKPSYESCYVNQTKSSIQVVPRSVSADVRKLLDKNTPSSKNSNTIPATLSRSNCVRMESNSTEPPDSNLPTTTDIPSQIVLPESKAIYSINSKKSILKRTFSVETTHLDHFEEFDNQLTKLPKKKRKNSDLFDQIHLL